MTDAIRLICKEGSSNKFWMCVLDGATTSVTYGKIGTSGQNQSKSHGTPDKARAFMDKMVREKLNKGYSKAALPKGTPAAAAAAAAPKRKAAKQDVDDDDDDGGDDEEEEKKAKPAKRGRAAAKKEEEEEEEDEDEDDDDDGDDDDEDEEEEEDVDDLAPEGTAVPVRFVLNLGSGATEAFGLFADEKSVLAGDENGVVVDCTHTATEIKLVRKIQLPDGVKAIVKDGKFLYAGTNAGEIFDLTQEEPRSMCQIENFGEIFWIDVYEGCVAASSATGDVAFINGEGEIIWKVEASRWPGKGYASSAWMCRADATGVYVGHSAGVAKYALKDGKLLWRNEQVENVLFGVQTSTHVFATGCDPKSSKGSTLKIDKKTGKSVISYPYQGSSCAVSKDGKIVVVEHIGYDGATAESKFNFAKADDRNLLRGMSAAVVGTKLFTIIDDDELSLIDISPAAIKKGLAGDGGKRKSASAASAAAVAVSTTVETTADASKGIEVECVKEGSKLRIRPVTKGFDVSWNVQFPRALRVAGAHYVCEDLVESTAGGFYRAVGKIQRLSKK